MRKGEEEEEDDREGGSTEELTSADAIRLQTCSSPAAAEQWAPKGAGWSFLAFPPLSP